MISWFLYFIDDNPFIQKTADQTLMFNKDLSELQQIECLSRDLTYRVIQWWEGFCGFVLRQALFKRCSAPQGFTWSGCRPSAFPSVGLDFLYFDQCVKFMASAVFPDKSLMTMEKHCCSIRDLSDWASKGKQLKATWQSLLSVRSLVGHSPFQL